MVARLVKLFFLIVFFMWIAILPVRSIIYVTRTIKEFIQGPKHHYDYIKPCSEDLELNTFEKERFFKYRSLGVKCEK